MQTQASNRNLVNLILKGLAVAMGVAVVTLHVLGTASAGSLFTLLGIGLFALSMSALQSE